MYMQEFTCARERLRAVRCVGGFCGKCCRILLDKPELRVVLCVCAGARLRFNARSHTTDLGDACKFSGGGFSLVLSRYFLRRVLPCTIG